MYKNFAACFWDQRLNLHWFRQGKWKACQLKSLLQEMDLEQLILLNKRTSHVNMSEMAECKGFADQKVHFALHPETRSRQWFLGHAVEYPA